MTACVECAFKEVMTSGLAHNEVIVLISGVTEPMAAHSRILRYPIPYCTIPYHAMPYHTILYHNIPYYTIPYHTIPYYCITVYIPHHTIPNHTIKYIFYQILEKKKKCGSELFSCYDQCCFEPEPGHFGWRRFEGPAPAPA